jgi:hypothetical protein
MLDEGVREPFRTVAPPLSRMLPVFASAPAEPMESEPLPMAIVPALLTAVEAPS